ncbi:unnamed protein product [Calicophoron daubneyi]|uniref:Uncharacterized protein n=1 Tax=Calicophoron daubneyi TaxID=300641 RepID=A0AAV2TRY3_CALDB
MELFCLHTFSVSVARANSANLTTPFSQIGPLSLSVICSIRLYVLYVLPSFMHILHVYFSNCIPALFPYCPNLHGLTSFTGRCLFLSKLVPSLVCYRSLGLVSRPFNDHSELTFLKNLLG